jgi:hypothetical protein
MKQISWSAMHTGVIQSTVMTTPCTRTMTDASAAVSNFVGFRFFKNASKFDADSRKMME